MNEPKDPFTAAEAWLQRMLDPKIFHPFRKKRDDSPYPSFNDRLSAMLIDGVWAFFLLGPVIQAIHPLVYGTLADAPPTHATDFGDFYRQMLRSGQLQKLMIENGITYALTGLIVVGMWSYASATPGKWLLRMRILRERDHARPTMTQWWLRYLGYLLFVPGFLWILFDPKRRAWQDLLARTVVVKVDHWRIRDDGSLPHVAPVPPSPPEKGEDGRRRGLGRVVNCYYRLLRAPIFLTSGAHVLMYAALRIQENRHSRWRAGAIDDTP